MLFYGHEINKVVGHSSLLEKTHLLKGAKILLRIHRKDNNTCHFTMTACVVAHNKIQHLYFFFQVNQTHGIESHNAEVVPFVPPVASHYKFARKWHRLL